MSDSGEVVVEDSVQDFGDQRPEWEVYPLTLYKFDYSSMKAGKGLIFRLSDEIMAKRMKSYTVEGMRTTVCGILLSHRKGFPCILLLQRDGDKSFGLLGGKCKKVEDPRKALCSKLARFVALAKHKHQLNIKDTLENIQVGELLCDLWRCDFNSEPLPYLPLHTNRPKEKISLYQVTLSENCKINAPKGYTLKFVPLYDFYNPEFGLSIASLPHLLSRFNISYMYSDRD